MKNAACLFIALWMLTSFANAQSNELPASIPKGRIFTDEGIRIKFTNLASYTDKCIYNITQTDKAQVIATANISRIEKQSGSEAGKWALIMGGAGFLGSMIAVLGAKNSLDSSGLEYDRSKFVPIVIGITSVTALIGVGIGSGKKKYKTVYKNPLY